MKLFLHTLEENRMEKEGPRRWAPVLFLFVTWVGLFHASLLGRGVFYYRDILQNYRPLLATLRTAIGSARLPWWNPYLGLGQPLMANPNYLILHPNSFLLAFFPVDYSTTLSILLGTALALAGTFALLRDLEYSRVSSLTGACAFGLSGLFLSLGNLPNLLASASWLPLCLLLLRRFWRRPSAFRGLAAALGTGLLCISAEVATLFAFGLIGAAMTLHGEQGKQPEERFPAAGRRLWQLVWIWVAGALIAAVQWLPFTELLSRSRRGEGFIYEIAAKWSFHPIRFLEFLVPGLFGNPTSVDIRENWGLDFFATGFPFFLSVYVGPLVILLAIGCLVKRPSPMEKALLGAILASLLLALGSHTPLHAFLYSGIPGFDTIRYPVRFLLGAQLALAILAARGLDKVFLSGSGERGGGRSMQAIRWGSLTAVIISLLLVLSGGTGSISRVLAARMVSPAVADRVLTPLEGAFRSGILRVAMLCAATYLVLYLYRRGRLGRSLSAGSILLILGVDLFLANRGVNPIEPPDFYAQPLPIVSFLRAQGGEYRVQREERPDGVRIRMPDPSVSWGYAWDRATLSRATPMEFGIRMGYGKRTDYLDLARPARFYQRAGELDGGDRVRLLCRSGVKFLLSYRDLSGWNGLREVASLGARSDPPIRLYELPCAMPRAYAVGGVRLVETPEEAFELMVSDRFDPSTVVALESTGEQAGFPVPASIPCRVVVDEPGRVEMEVRAAQPGYAVLLENRYPGWKAWVDGKESSIHAANGLFQAVAVPAGNHRVRFEYRPRYLLRSGLLSFLGLVLGGVGLPILGKLGTRVFLGARTGVPVPTTGSR